MGKEVILLQEATSRQAALVTQPTKVNHVTESGQGAIPVVSYQLDLVPGTAEAGRDHGIKTEKNLTAYIEGGHKSRSNGDDTHRESGSNATHMRLAVSETVQGEDAQSLPD